MASKQRTVTLFVPPGGKPGQLLTAKSPFDGQEFDVHIPEGNELCFLLALTCSFEDFS